MDADEDIVAEAEHCHAIGDTDGLIEVVRWFIADALYTFETEVMNDG